MCSANITRHYYSPDADINLPPPSTDRSMHLHYPSLEGGARKRGTRKRREKLTFPNFDSLKGCFDGSAHLLYKRGAIVLI